MRIQDKTFGKLVDVYVVRDEYMGDRPLTAYVSWGIPGWSDGRRTPFHMARGVYRQLGLAITHCEKLRAAITEQRRRKHY